MSILQSETGMKLLKDYIDRINSRYSDGGITCEGDDKHKLKEVADRRSIEEQQPEYKTIVLDIIPVDKAFKFNTPKGAMLEEDKHKIKEVEGTAVNPSHYDLFPEYGIQVREVIGVLCDKLDKQGYSGLLVSDYVQAMQYFMRWMEKNGEEDIAKGIWFMNKIIEQLKEEPDL